MTPNAFQAFITRILISAAMLAILAAPLTWSGLTKSANAAGGEASGVEIDEDMAGRLDYFAAELRSDFDAYGINERRTIRAMERLAQLYRSRGFDNEAIALYGICLDAAAEVYGVGAKESVVEMGRLAAIHLELGNILTAEALLADLAERQTKLSGPDHPDTLSALADLSIVKNQLGQTREGLALARRILEKRTELLGPLHEQTANAKLLLARHLGAVPEYEEALAILQELIEESKQSLGPFFPDRLSRDAMRLETELRWSMGDMSGALASQEAIVESAESAAADNPSPEAATQKIEALMALAAIRLESGQPQAALAIFENLAAYSKSALGADHRLSIECGLALEEMASIAKAAEAEAASMAAPGEKEAGASSSSASPGADGAAPFKGAASTSASIASAADEASAVKAAGRDLEEERSELVGALVGKLTTLEDNNEIIIDLFTRLADVCERLGSLEEAAIYGKLAIENTQAHKFSQRGSPNDFRQLYMSRVANRYHLLAKILFESGRVEEALKVLSLLKIDELGGLSDAPKAMTDLFIGPEIPLIEAYRALVKTLRDSGRQAMLNLIGSNRVEALARPLPTPEADLAALRGWFESLRTALDGAGEILVQSVDQLRHGGGFFNLAASMGANAALVHTLIDEDGVYLVLTGPDFRTLVKSPVEKRRLSAMIRGFRDSLENPASDPKPLAKSLYAILVAPLEDRLKAMRADTLIFSLDGLLRLIPMAALHDGQNWLVERYAASLISGAGLLEASGSLNERDETTIAAIGVSRALSGFSALPAVVEEIQTLVKDEANPDGLYPGVKILDEGFTYPRLQEVLADSPVFVHLASHFEFDPGDHRNSRLLLGDGSQLTLARLDYDDALSFSGVRHISLSACQTAVGEIGEDGREVESLGSLIHRRGAGSVLASLWRVDDASTQRLMRSFYETQKDGALNRAKALRTAQLSFIQSGGVATSVAATRGKVSVSQDAASENGERDLAHPYFWAPFIIMGDFR